MPFATPPMTRFASCCPASECKPVPVWVAPAVVVSMCPVPLDLSRDSLRSSQATDDRRTTPRRFARGVIADRTITGDQSPLDMLAKLLTTREPEIRNVQVPVVADSRVRAPAIERRVVRGQADARQIVAFAEVDRLGRQWPSSRDDDLGRVHPRELRWIRSKQKLRITERPATISHEIHFTILLTGKIRGPRAPP